MSTSNHVYCSPSYYLRALEIQEAKLGLDDVQVAVTLYELGRCVVEVGRPGEAEALFCRALKIKEAEMGPDDVRVAATLHEIACSVPEAGRPGDAEPLLQLGPSWGPMMSKLP
ncbi:unnamed protein product [Ectocarpus sp. 12 AP-2014]